MNDDGDDVDPTNPRSENHHERFQDSPWYYINGELTQTLILGPAADAEPGDGWILLFTGEDTVEASRERVYVRLTPRALHELYIETKDLSSDARQVGHTAERDLCGESAPLKRAIPSKREEPIHKRCYVDVYNGPVWMEDH